MFDVDIIVEMVSFVSHKVLQPLSVLKMLKCTDNCSGNFGRKMLIDHLLFAADHHGRLLSYL